MSKAQNIIVETTVKAAVQNVWHAYTTPEAIMKWNAASDDWHTTAASVDLRAGGLFSSRMEAKDGSMGFDFAGTYTTVIPNKLIAYAFGNRTAQVEFVEYPEDVLVRVSFEPEAENPVDMQRGGWQSILDSFKTYVESGGA